MRSSTRFGTLAAAWALMVLVLGTAPAAAQPRLTVAPPAQTGTPATAYELVFNIQGATNPGPLTVNIRSLETPVQNYALDGAIVPLSRAGTGETRLRVIVPGSGADAYGVWRFRASTFVGSRELTADFRIDMPLTLRQERTGDTVRAPLGTAATLGGLKVVDEAGRGVPNVAVAWEAAGPEASRGQAASNARGEVVLPFVARAPGRYEVVARLAEPGPIFRGDAKFFVQTTVGLARVGPESRAGVPGESQDLEVRIVDAANKPASGVAVEWRVMGEPSGAGARLAAAESQTQNGLARMPLTVGEKVGTYRVEAAVKRVPGALPLASDPVVFTVTTVPGKELEARRCRDAREALPAVTAEWTTRYGAYDSQVKALQAWEKARAADLQRLDTAVKNLDAAQAAMRPVVDKMNEQLSSAGTVVGWSAFLSKFGTLLAHAATVAGAGYAYAAEEATKKLIGTALGEFAAFEVLGLVADHFGPDRARERFQGLVEARDAAQAAHDRMVKHYVAMSQLLRARKTQWQRQGEQMAVAATQAGEHANVTARRLREVRERYQRCEEQLLRAGVSAEEIHENWPEGRAGHDKFVRQAVLTAERVTARGF
jgi:hypothetical protein